MPDKSNIIFLNICETEFDLGKNSGKYSNIYIEIPS